MSLFLEIAVQEAIERIKRAYAQTNGKIFLSFSGGKDSTVLAELIKMADLPTDVPFVFANTGIELDATYEFVKNYDYSNMVVIKPRKPFAHIIRDYGVPALSKTKSQFLNTYQNALRDGKNPLDSVRVTRLLGLTGDGRDRIANKHLHFLHPDHEYRIANQCCQYMKKYPFEDYAKEHGMEGTYAGIRVAEGGVRATAYKSCTVFRKKGKRDELLSMPIYDWSDELVEQFIEAYGVKLSRAYTEYGQRRTGCIGCPFSKDLEQDLPMLQEKEPLKYKAVMKWLGTVYMDMGIELPNDPEYMEQFVERKKIIEKRRLEMFDMYRKNK